MLHWFLGPIYFIIGGVVGGILLIVISIAMVILFCICKRCCAQKKKRKGKILYWILPYTLWSWYPFLLKRSCLAFASDAMPGRIKEKVRSQTDSQFFHTHSLVSGAYEQPKVTKKHAASCILGCHQSTNSNEAVSCKTLGHASLQLHTGCPACACIWVHIILYCVVVWYYMEHYVDIWSMHDVHIIIMWFHEMM